MLNKKAIAVLICGSLASIGCLGGCFAGCSGGFSGGKPVSVEKVPLTITTRYIEEVRDKSTIPLAENEEAITKWKFGCKTDIRFDIISKEIIDPEYLVSIKITGVKIILDAPVTIWISKKADPETLAHEKAHALICSKVYERSEQAAEDAGVFVVGKTYQASGKSVEDACKIAVDRASKEVCELYHLKAVEAINRVSEIFDGLEQHHLGKDPRDDVEAAFLQYVDITEIRKPAK